MSFLQRLVAHCDQCSHEWLVVAASIPMHCAKCKSRRWNLDAIPPRTDKPIQFYRMELPAGAVAQPDRALAKEPEAVGSIPTAPIKPNMQDLRDICAGKTIQQVFTDIQNREPAEIPICGKTWWEDGEQYECLMDKGHRELKHGMRGMVRRLDGI